MNDIIQSESAVSPYRDTSHEDLIDGIKKASGKARAKGLEMIEHMKRAGHMLIELKTRLPHGRFMDEAEYQTNLPHRTITRYMEMARGTLPHKTVKTGERGGRKDRTIGFIKDTEFLFLDGGESGKMATVANLETTEADDAEIVSTSKPPPPPPAIIDAEVVEPPAEVMQEDEPDPVVVDECNSARRPPMRVIESEGMNIWKLAKSHLDRINKNDEFREKSLKACIEYCEGRLPKQKGGRPYLEIMHRLPELSQDDLHQLVNVIQTRWLR